MKIWFSCLSLAFLLPALHAAIADELPGVEGELAAEAARVRVGVASFEVAGPSGVEVPDFATLLADLLGTRGVGRIVGPEQFGAPATAQIEASAARAWAAAAAVDGVVVGRTTQLGSRFSVDVRLLSATSGAVVDTYIAEIARTDQVTSAVATLADQVIAGVLSLMGPADFAAPPAARSAAGSDPSLRAFDSSAPISIRSNSLEAAEVNGNRRLVFSGDVNVVQDDITMTSNQLTADYAEGASEPSRLVAQGSVRVVQGKQEAQCDSGTFERAEELLVCCGNAELRDGSSRVRGKCIEFDLRNQTVRVEDATVNIIPEPSDGGSGNPGGR
ncbi:MAG: LptA/OstA family protein [Myxococcota bacterium]